MDRTRATTKVHANSRMVTFLRGSSSLGSMVIPTNKTIGKKSEVSSLFLGGMCFDVFAFNNTLMSELENTVIHLRTCDVAVRRTTGTIALLVTVARSVGLRALLL